MTTPRDLLIIVVEMDAGRPVERGDLSLALAGAEAIDLLTGEDITLADHRIVPGIERAMPDMLLDEAVSSLHREAPYEPIGDWLWRRGRGLSDAYLATLEAEGLLTRQRRRHWMFLRDNGFALADSSARRTALNRWAADEPVLVTLAEAIGLRDPQPAEDSPSAADDSVTAVLDAVGEAVSELSAERQRRARRLQDAAADNVQRGY
ncbi:GPP34 family phosphoprotein [Streptomyces sp. NPDC051320]|uniref:GOLPH3/VPS74 family protein n=1 Tax=Streptomyces sp. NPDC051320 TaxID=3154644 RepID=UPI00343241BF